MRSKRNTRACGFQRTRPRCYWLPYCKWEQQECTGVDVSDDFQGNINPNTTRKAATARSDSTQKRELNPTGISGTSSGNLLSLFLSLLLIFILKKT